ncbi:MAG: hypothetical protein RIQ41_261 [Candidatus Parcubacteria bacterium]|jgi:hypothetical protein
MEEGLFAKHVRVIKAKQAGKQEVLSLIVQTTGISLTEDEVTLSKKRVTITTSSATKTILTQKKLRAHLEAAGYSLTF